MATTSNAIASTSRNPSSHLPLSLSVSQRDDANQLLPQTSDVQALKESAQIKRWRMRECEKWVDRLMFKEKVELKGLKRASSYLQPHHYQTILHERHLTSVCSYPPCSNPPYRPFSSSPGWKLVSLKPSSAAKRKHDFVRTEGNYEDGFCSIECRARSTWFERGLRAEPVWVREVESETGRRGWEVEELLEDLERDSKCSFGKDGKEEKDGQLKRGEQPLTPVKHVGGEEKAPPSGHEVKKYEVDVPPTVEVATPLASISLLTPAEEASLRPKALAQILEAEEMEELPQPAVEQEQETSRKTAAPTTKPTASNTSKQISLDPQGQFTKLLSELRIIERETPTDHVPAPPSLGPAAQEGISELAPLPVTPGKVATSTVATGRMPATSVDGTISVSQGQVNTISSPPTKDKEKARRQFMQKGSYITPAPGKAAEDVKTVSKEATAAYLAQQGSAAAAAQLSEQKEPNEDVAEETDSEQALEDLIFEQMEAARKEMEEEDRW